MKVKFAAIVIVFAGLSLIGCSESSQPPVAPTNGSEVLASAAEPAQGSLANLNNRGVIIHMVQGSANGTYEGKNMVWTIAGHQYADGSFDGQYEINAANALGESYQKWHGKVAFLKVYGNLCVVGGAETGGNAGWYDVFFFIDNGEGGNAVSPDQASLYVAVTQDLVQAQRWWNLDPEILKTSLEVCAFERGNVTIK